ncbi:hypothetical protein Scep_004231 [Stephania cephalantha]|uniref:Uncharacterized protein n=1 Tax=Stephania cephalantha TaxID=152367 RepID=A0AAP0PV61_9MAGN
MVKGVYKSMFWFLISSKFVCKEKRRKRKVVGVDLVKKKSCWYGFGEALVRKKNNNK